MKNIEHYNILEPIGQGGMSTVYRAQNSKNGHFLSIKLMRESFSENGRARERFIQEAQMVIALQHPAIVPVFDYGEVNGRLYIVMQYMAGGSIRELLRDGALPYAQTVTMLTPIASAIDTAHQNKIIHRDIKPHNILIDEAGNAYLSDFGVARLLDESSLEHTMTLVGTPEFIAPEQAAEGGLTAQTDVYQLGVTLFFMLTGEMPFTGSSLQLIQKHLYEPLPSAEALNPQLPLGCDHILQIATAKKPQDRFATAGALLDALTQLTTEGTKTEIFAAQWLQAGKQDVYAFVEAAPEVLPETAMHEPEKRNRIRPFAYAAFLIMVLIGLVALRIDSSTDTAVGQNTVPVEVQVENDPEPIATAVPVLPAVVDEAEDGGDEPELELAVVISVEETEPVIAEVVTIENVDTAVTAPPTNNDINDNTPTENTTEPEVENTTTANPPPPRNNDDDNRRGGDPNNNNPPPPNNGNGNGGGNGRGNNGGGN